MLVAGLLLLAAAPPAGGCTLSVGAAADDSFALAGYDSGPVRLARLAALTRDRFAAAARKLCAAGLLRPADLARFRQLVVQNGEGATEPLIYRAPHMARATWVFQFAFQEGGPPEAAEFERALLCWKRPRSDSCSGD